MPVGRGSVIASGTDAGLLRRADWRFLLPILSIEPLEHAVLLGGPNGLDETLMATGFATRVSRSVPVGRSADVLIMLVDAGVALERAVGCLKAGGGLYYELDRRLGLGRGSTPRRSIHTIHTAGLSLACAFWRIPNFSSGRLYLPIDTPGALEWYARTLFVARSPRHLLYEVGLRLFARLRRGHLAAVAPRWALTAVAGPHRGGAPSVLAHPALPSEVRGRNLRPLVLTGGAGVWSRVTMLPFSTGELEPTGVVKLARLPLWNRYIEREQAILTETRSGQDSMLCATLPRPLRTFAWQGLQIGVESYAPGRPLSTSSGRWGRPIRRKIEDLRLASDWLESFHALTTQQTAWGESEIERWVVQPFDAYAAAFAVTSGEKRLFSEARRCATSLLGRSLPIVQQHKDFGDWNIFRRGADVTVIDWEVSRIGPALCDLLYFVTHWSHTIGNVRDARAQQRRLRQFFFGGAQEPSQVSAREAIVKYMRRLDISPSFLPLLLVCTYVEQALERVQRLRECGDAGAVDRSSNQYVGYLSVLAEHVQQLFHGAESYLNVV